MRRGFEMRRRAGGHRTVSHESAHDLRMNPGFASHSPAAAHCEQLGISSAHVLDPRAAGSGGAGRCRPPSPHVPHDFAQFGPMYAGFCSHWPCLAHASQLSSASVHASAASAASSASVSGPSPLLHLPHDAAQFAPMYTGLCSHWPCLAHASHFSSVSLHAPAASTASSASDRAASASAPALARLLAPSSSGGRGGSGSSHEPPTAATTATASTPTAAADAPNDPLPLPFARASAAAFALGIGAGSVRILPKLVSDLRSCQAPCALSAPSFRSARPPA